MSDAKFEKVTHSDQALYGPRRLVLCGFGVEAQSKFMTVLGMIGMADVPVTWAGHDQQEMTLGELMGLADQCGRGEDSPLPRALIVAGITEGQLHTLMGVCRRAGMKNALWATLTPTSEKWTLAYLLAELGEERRQLAALQKRKFQDRSG